MQFDDLARRLPASLAQPTLEIDQGSALTIDPTRVRNYIAPGITVLDWPEDASVLLVEAAGAVGKTSAAAALAQALNWPLVRAEQAYVGSYALSGLLQDALGHNSDYMKQLVEGRAGVVVDSLDEAHLKSGTPNFEAFLSNVRTVAGSRYAESGRRPSVVLFSRSDTATFIRVAFLEANVSLAVAKLDFFNQVQAERFISGFMEVRFEETGRPEYNSGLNHSVAFGRLRDARFLQLLRTVSGKAEADLAKDWSAAADFLGYAPVLIALAEALSVSNPSAESKALSGVLQTNQSDLFINILERILEREQKKFSDQQASKLWALLPASSTEPLKDGLPLYSPE